MSDKKDNEEFEKLHSACKVLDKATQDLIKMAFLSACGYKNKEIDSLTKLLHREAEKVDKYKQQICKVRSDIEVLSKNNKELLDQRFDLMEDISLTKNYVRGLVSEIEELKNLLSIIGDDNG